MREEECVCMYVQHCAVIHVLFYFQSNPPFTKVGFCFYKDEKNHN